MDEAIDVEEVLDHTDIHHQVVIHHPEGQADAIGRGDTRTTTHFTDSTTHYYSFRLNSYFTDEVWDLLVIETNRYAHANTSSRPHSTA